MNFLFLDSDLDLPRFIVSPRGHYQVVDSRGYIYSNKGTVNSKKYWECTNRIVNRTNCSARVSTIDSKIVRFTNEHNHLPPSSANRA